MCKRCEVKCTRCEIKLRVVNRDGSTSIVPPRQPVVEAPKKD